MFKFLASLNKRFMYEKSLVDLDPPTVVGALPPIPGGEENLLPKDAWQQPLRIEFPLWSDAAPEAGMYDTVELIWDENEAEPVATKRWEGPLEPDSPPADLWLEVPVAKLDEGIHSVYYQLHPWNSSTPRRSVRIKVTIDKTPPQLAFNNVVLIDPTIVEDGLSEQYLIDNNGIVAVSVPTYLEPAPGDRIVCAWKNEGNGQQREVSRTLTEDDYEEFQFQLEFDEALIRDMGDGPRSISYRVFDRAGNESPESDPVSFLVAVLRAPHYVPYPWIDEAEGNPSQYADLNPLRAINGATAQIPEDAVYYDDDIVSMQFGEPGTAGAIVVPVPWGVKSVTIPAASIAAMFNKDVPMYYGVKLADGTSMDSEKLTVQVGTFTQFPPPQLESPFTTPVSKAAIPAGGLPVHQKKWAFISEACLVTIKVSGLNKSLTVLDKHKVVAAEVSDGVHVKLPRDFMLSLPTDTQFIVQTQVSFDDGEHWQFFTELRPMLKA